MKNLHHLNCVRIISPVNDNVCGHCLLLQEQGKLILIDTGIGLLDTLMPEERIGRPLIDLVGYSFNEEQTAFRQIEKLGLDPGMVTDCVISHLDNDHIGGLADFPKASVHVGVEEFENYRSGNPRYLEAPLAHHPIIKTYPRSNDSWFGFEARKVDIDIDTDIYLIPLFGHTLGHCGIALRTDNNWIFYVGDAYYMRIELSDATHPVNQLAKARAENDTLRIQTLDKIKNLMHQQPNIEVFGYHDIEEFYTYKKLINKSIINAYHSNRDIYQSANRSCI